MPRRMPAKAMFWIGAMIVVITASIGFFFDTVAFTIWGTSVYSNEALSYVRLALAIVVLPLVIGFLALSVIARHLERRGDSDQGARIPPRLTSRWVLWLGVTLAVVGFVLRESLTGWLYELSGDGGGILFDFLSYVALPLQPVIIPLGILLVPCSFLIASLEARSAEESGVRAHRTVNIIARPVDDAS